MPPKRIYIFRPGSAPEPEETSAPASTAAISSIRFSGADPQFHCNVCGATWPRPKDWRRAEARCPSGCNHPRGEKASKR